MVDYAKSEKLLVERGHITMQEIKNMFTPHCPRYTVDTWNSREHRISDNKMQKWVCVEHTRWPLSFTTKEEAQRYADTLNGENNG